mmetsp:Transcript_5578/g.16825  ORF Transcript_5578/g.16825 Transcript_5578/m.16825 type:complete len:205 (+) Transcript_5578:2090-2704(+)
MGLGADSGSPVIWRDTASPLGRSCMYVSSMWDGANIGGCDGRSGDTADSASDILGEKRWGGMSRSCAGASSLDGCTVPASAARAIPSTSATPNEPSHAVAASSLMVPFLTSPFPVSSPRSTTQSPPISWLAFAPALPPAAALSPPESRLVVFPRGGPFRVDRLNILRCRATDRALPGNARTRGSRGLRTEVGFCFYDSQSSRRS